jgi:hypothetical protein
MPTPAPRGRKPPRRPAPTARLTLACQRVGLEFGAARAAGLRAMPALARQAAGQRALLRIDMPQGAPPAGSMVQVGDGAEAMRLKVLGPATGGDAQLQTAGVLALAEGAAARARQRGPRVARPYRRRRRAGAARGARCGPTACCTPIAPRARTGLSAWP